MRDWFQNLVKRKRLTIVRGCFQNLVKRKRQTWRGCHHCCSSFPPHPPPLLNQKLGFNCTVKLLTTWSWNRHKADFEAQLAQILRPPCKYNSNSKYSNWQWASIIPIVYKELGNGLHMFIISCRCQTWFCKCKDEVISLLWNKLAKRQRCLTHEIISQAPVIIVNLHIFKLNWLKKFLTFYFGNQKLKSLPGDYLNVQGRESYGFILYSQWPMVAWHSTAIMRAFVFPSFFSILGILDGHAKLFFYTLLAQRLWKEIGWRNTKVILNQPKVDS